jgi:hypothetical protein
MKNKSVRLFFAVLALGLIILIGGHAQQLSRIAYGATPAANQLFLPLVRSSDRGAQTPTATATTPGNPPPVGNISLARFVEQTLKTSDANVVVDANGGSHMAFYYYESTFDDHPTSAVYAYCPSQCEQGDRWQQVQLAEAVNEVQLALDPAGKPRLLIRADSEVHIPGQDYIFAECNDTCTTVGGWTLTLIASTSNMTGFELQDDELPQRSFALDPAGRPRFVYVDNNGQTSPAHRGAYYAFCDSECTNRDQWQEVRVNTVIEQPQYRDEGIYYPSLAFTADGKPRLATADFSALDDSGGMAYIACDANCEDTANWHKVVLAPRGGGAEPSADIEVDAEGRPRIAFYQESLLDNQGKRLFYFWCNDGCLEAANWHQHDLELTSFDGQEPDLELDSRGNPRIAYADWNSGGLGYAWCDQACDSDAAQWEHKLIETRTDLQEAWDVPFPLDHCDAGFWNSLTPTLDLVGDKAHVAYDATYHARCYYDDNPNDNIPPDWHYGLVMRSVRQLVFTQPFTQPSDPGAPTATRTPTPTATATATQTPTITPTPSPTPVSITKRSARFAEPQGQTSSASTAVDGTGGRHLAYVSNETQTAAYGYCATSCENPAGWQTVTLADAANEVQMELDLSGNPRLLIRRTSSIHADGYDYLYAQCDGGCTAAESWEVVQVASARGGSAYEQQDARQPQRSFELDPNGRPRLVYIDENATADPFHVGVYYTWCDAGCTNALAWQEVRITEVVQWDGVIEGQERALYLALAFSPEGYPRVITAEFFPLNGGENRLTYIECDELCEVGYLWQKVQLYERGEGPIPAVDLEIDAQGHPHVAFYQGKTEAIMPDGSRPMQPESVLYATCPQDHCMTVMNWDAQHIGVQGVNGPGPDLELDAQGRPRIAYTHGEKGGIGYSWCNGDCLSYTDGTWQHGIIETRTELQSAWPVTDPANCAQGGWQGWAPALMLPASGDPQVAYDAAYVAACAGQDVVVQSAVRLVTFAQP